MGICADPVQVTPAPAVLLADEVNPLAGMPFYVNPTSAAMRAAQSANPPSPELTAIANTPQAYWIVPGSSAATVAKYTGATQAAGAVPVLTLYGIPHRDCGSFAAGGFATAADYRAWIDGIANDDKPVLGPWINTVRQNILAGTIVWILVLLSLALTVATFFPDLTTSTYEIGFAVGAGMGIAGGALIALSRRRDDRRLVEQAFGDLDPDQITDLDDAATGTLTRDERKALTAQDRATWRTPALATLERPVMSPLRKAGLLTLRGYLIVAAVMVVVKIVQTATGG
jgi:hypothetical protein